MSQTLYVKVDKNVLIQTNSVHLRDFAEIFCAEKPVEAKVKSLRFPTPQIHGPGRYVYSILDVIGVIDQEYPNLDIQNLGETDFIFTVEKTAQPGIIRSWCKTAAVCILAFFGAAFSIMAFNNDVGITSLFGQLYETFTGQKSDGFTILEVSYSVGVGLGILIFFHHFARKKGVSDPTPLEVEMRTYEEEIDMTTIEASGRAKRRTD